MDAPDRPMLYRFDGSPNTLGPRILKWIVDCYGSRDECAAAPEELAKEPSAWHPMSHWCDALAMAPATAAQMKRLASAGTAPHDGITYEAARALLDRKRRNKPPTALKLRKLVTLGLVLPFGATREIVDDLIRADELRRRGDALAAAGLLLPASGVTDDNVHELEDAVETLRVGVKQAQERGLKYAPPLPLSEDAMRELAAVLEEFWSVAGDLADSWETLRDEGIIPRLPSSAQREAVLPGLLDSMLSVDWGYSESEILALARRALGMPVGKRAG